MGRCTSTMRKGIGWRFKLRSESGGIPATLLGRGGDAADMSLEVGVLALEQLREGGAEVIIAAPLPHVILPGGPEAAGLLGHPYFVYEDVGALENGDEDAEKRGAALELLVGKGARSACPMEELQVRVIEHELEESHVFVR